MTWTRLGLALITTRLMLDYRSFCGMTKEQIYYYVYTPWNDLDL